MTDWMEINININTNIQYSKGARNFNVFGVFMPKNFEVKLFSCMHMTGLSMLFPQL
jgi:hypothetical protein